MPEAQRTENTATEIGWSNTLVHLQGELLLTGRTKSPAVVAGKHIANTAARRHQGISEK